MLPLIFYTPYFPPQNLFLIFHVSILYPRKTAVHFQRLVSLPHLPVLYHTSCKFSGPCNSRSANHKVRQKTTKHANDSNGKPSRDSQERVDEYTTSITECE